MPKSRQDYYRGWNDAIGGLHETFCKIPEHVPLNDDRQWLLDLVLQLCDGFEFDDESLLRKPNRELAKKYSVSPRTITNWRKAGCPFEDGQWAVLDWAAERRIVPAVVEAARA